MPIRHGDMFASRASTWPRDHFCRSTMAPRRSRPITWNEFLPISMPIVAMVAIDLLDMAVLRLTLAPSQHHSPVGQEHGRTIPLAEETDSFPAASASCSCPVRQRSVKPGANVLPLNVRARNSALCAGGSQLLAANIFRAPIAVPRFRSGCLFNDWSRDLRLWHSVAVTVRGLQASV